MENVQAHTANDSHVKVLVVDDHPNTAHMLARAISRLGSHVEVISATSGVEALQYVEDGAADILITDMMMPEMTGMELIETLYSQPSLSPAVTFLLTAHDSAGVREIAQRLNVKGVIAKPVHPEWICQLISQTIIELKQPKPASVKSIPPKRATVNVMTRPRQENLDISRLIWEVTKKFQPQADIKKQLLVVGKTEDDSKVMGNAAQLRQVLRNLVWTAIENTPKGGTVILSSENESGMVRIHVRDTGYSLPSAELPGNSDLITGGGYEDDDTDQYLANTRSIVERHGGTVTVESEVGKGTCFTMSLPLVEANNSLVENRLSAGNEFRSV